MNIDNLRINHIEKPLGYRYKTLTASYRVDDRQAGYQKAAQILVSKSKGFETVLFDTGRSESVRGSGTRIDFQLQPVTRYYWKVRVWNEAGAMAESDVSWFETGLMEKGFAGQFITPDMDASVQPVFVREFSIESTRAKARLYITCLGVYEAFLNGQRIGDEALAPGVTAYDKVIQYQTYDVTGLLREGSNRLEVSAGHGWYKGKYGYRQNEKYCQGKQFELLADLYMDGKLVVCSDLSWRARPSKILCSDIYDGELQDPGFDDTKLVPVTKGKLDKGIVRERLSLPVKVKETVKPAALIETPKGEMVLDMGQNMVGWVRFTCREAEGRKVRLEHGEVLQDGCFYRDNYRTAKAMFEYISDGTEREVHARLCFFGFRYVRLTGFTDINPADFTGDVIYSDLPRTGFMQTGNQLINQLISNVGWSQKGNFLDIPTDCPQRDERLGWTGDAQMFAGTASLNRECYAFFRKYLNDIACDQEDAKGLVPQIVPSVDRKKRTSAAWGDAALIIPWTMYWYYGDASILEEQYESMKGWIAYIDDQNKQYHTNPSLWQNGFHYGDWLALDGGYYHMPTGGTDVYYISSAYFFYSTVIMAKTAAVLKRDRDAGYYREKAEGIRKAIIREYFTGSKKLSIDTQAACIIAVVFGIVTEERQVRQVKEQFLHRLRKDGYSLKTGFVGTPFILKMLSLCGRDDLAFALLLNEEYPGWLYPVKLGATTMWERWDAINPDGSISDTGMNSLNHYLNGSVQEWMYCYMAGIRPAEEEAGAGFGRAVIEPRVHPDIGWMDTAIQTAAGRYRVYWRITEEEKLLLTCEIPFHASAEIRLPAAAGEILLNGQVYAGETIMAGPGCWDIEYRLDKSCKPHYRFDDSVKKLAGDPEVKAYLYKKVPMLERIDGADIQNMTLEQLAGLPFFLGIGTKLGLESEVLEEIRQYLETR